MRTGVSMERTLREAARLAFCDIGRLFDENSKLKDLKEWDEETAAAVASIDVVEEFRGKGKDRRLVGYVKKVKFCDEIAALDKLMKHLGLYEQDNAHVPTPLPPTFVIVGV